MLSEVKIQALVSELALWPGRVIKTHNDAGHMLHKLVFLADLGLKGDDAGMQQVVERILALRSPEGVFELMVNIKPAYGGSGEDQPAWMLCDAPLVWYDLLNVLDVLTAFPWLYGDRRLQEMLDILQGKADNQGRFMPESIWTAWKDWEFGQKKQASQWITLIALRALKRAGRI
jgi:hypothetical protein